MHKLFRTYISIFAILRFTYINAQKITVGFPIKESKNLPLEQAVVAPQDLYESPLLAIIKG